MDYPVELLYCESHEWVRIDGDEAVIGITSFAQNELGDVTFVDLPAVGDALQADEEMGSVESVKAASELYCPVSGTVLAVNERLDDSPELVNKAPYTDGWMIRIKLNGSTDALLSAQKYADFTANK